jgi:hypothetical protein
MAPTRIDALAEYASLFRPRGDVAALLLALPTAQYDHMPCETLATLCKGFQVGGTLGYRDR